MGKNKKNTPSKGSAGKGGGDDEDDDEGDEDVIEVVNKGVAGVKCGEQPAFNFEQQAPFNFGGQGGAGAQAFSFNFPHSALATLSRLSPGHRRRRR